MTSKERFERVLSFSGDADRLPVVEWATYWDQTVNRWKKEGFPAAINEHNDISDHFGLDKLRQFWFPLRSAECPAAASHGAPIIEDEEDYEKIRKYICSDEVLSRTEEMLKEYSEKENERDAAVWYTLEGFFWFPRTLFGIQGHFYAFYDYPELMIKINEDLCGYYKKLLDIVYRYIQPQFMTFAEDMSYNHGPMLSKEMYDKMIAPFYRELVPYISRRGTKVFIDTDGQVEPLIPWFLECGIEGILPLERMAGVDICRIRKNYPKLLMLGAFDKTVMHLGETAIRREFERILPVMKSGGYIAAVDHQTPPEVSLKDYELFLTILREYTGSCGKITI